MGANLTLTQIPAFVPNEERAARLRQAIATLLPDADDATSRQLFCDFVEVEAELEHTPTYEEAVPLWRELLFNAVAQLDSIELRNNVVQLGCGRAARHITGGLSWGDPPDTPFMTLALLGASQTLWDLMQQFLDEDVPAEPAVFQLPTYDPEHDYQPPAAPVRATLVDDAVLQIELGAHASGPELQIERHAHGWQVFIFGQRDQEELGYLRITDTGLAALVRNFTPDAETGNREYQPYIAECGDRIAPID